MTLQRATFARARFSGGGDRRGLGLAFIDGRWARPLLVAFRPLQNRLPDDRRAANRRVQQAASGAVDGGPLSAVNAAMLQRVHACHHPILRAGWLWPRGRGADQSSARRPSMRGGSGVLQTPRGSVRMLLVSPCGCSARKHQGSRQDTQVQSATVQPVSSHRKLHRNRAEEEQAQPAGSERPEHKGREAQRYARCPGRVWCRAAR